MKTIQVLLCICCIFCIPGISTAQDNAPTFFLVDYMKATPGKEGDYIKTEQEVWKAIHQKRISQKIITGWYFYEIRFPGGSSRTYDYVTVTRVQGWDKVEMLWSNWDELMKSLTKEQSAMVQNTDNLRQLVRTEVWMGLDEVFRPGDNPAKYQMVNFMDAQEGRDEDYLIMEKTLAKPIQQAEIQAGRRAGWGLYQMILPYGAMEPYDYGTVDFYDKWSDINSSDFDATIKKIHPALSPAYVFDQINSTRKLQKAELRVLIDFAQ